MRITNTHYGIRILAITALLLCFRAQEGLCAERPRTAKIIDLKGKAEMKPFKGKWTPAFLGMVLKGGDVVKTGKDSWALINVDGDGEVATLEIKENSQLLFSELVTDSEQDAQKTLLDLALGEVSIKAKKLHGEKAKFEVKTPTSIVGVRGTEFAVEVKALE